MASMTVRDLMDGLIKFRWDMPIMQKADYDLENIVSLREIDAFEVDNGERTWISSGGDGWGDSKITPIKILVIG